jgi:hypothetical protein
MRGTAFLRRKTRGIRKQFLQQRMQRSIVGALALHDTEGEQRKRKNE